MKIDVDVYLDSFPAYEVLEAALVILTDQLKSPKGLSREGQQIRDLLSADLIEATLPPPSTGSRIRTVSELQSWIAKDRPA